MSSKAEATFKAITMGTEERPIPTPIHFWDVSRSSMDERGVSCGNVLSVMMTLYGPNAGTVPGVGVRRFAARDADVAARDLYDDHVIRALKDGYVETSRSEEADRLAWMGTRPCPFGLGGTVTVSIQAVRRAARPDDPDILALADLLRTAPPSLALIGQGA